MVYIYIAYSISMYVVYIFSRYILFCLLIIRYDEIKLQVILFLCQSDDFKQNKVYLI